MQSQALHHRFEISHWPAVFSLFMGVTSLIAAEFLPISLLTQIAEELAIKEGVAGQAVTAVGVLAVITSLILAPLTKTIDRRLILLTFSVLVVISNIIVAIAPNYFVLLIGRCILGICVGGFWSMASAVTLQLVPKKDVPRALSIVYAGVSVATIISIPVASYVGYYLGWRNVFYLAALLGLIALIWQFLSLPSLPSYSENSFRGILLLTKQNWVLAGLVGTIFSYAGYHIFFTYLRPFLEHDLTLYANKLTLVLLAFGIANCLGTFISGLFLGKLFRVTMIMMHVILVIAALTLFATSRNIIGNTVLIMIWAFIFGFIPVGWSTWITRTLTNKAEIAGGLMVAAIQFSITIGAAVGGLMFDNYGSNGIFIIAAILLTFAILSIITSFSLFSKATGKKA